MLQDGCVVTADNRDAVAIILDLKYFLCETNRKLFKVRDKFKRYE